jgi:protein phosphatase
VLAAQNAAFHTRDHRWHLSFAERLAAADPDLFCATRHVIATTADAAAELAAIAWRQELTRVGGEGVVVKPLAQTKSAARAARPARPQSPRP